MKTQLHIINTEQRPTAVPVVLEIEQLSKHFETIGAGDQCLKRSQFHGPTGGNDLHFGPERMRQIHPA